MRKKNNDINIKVGIKIKIERMKKKISQNDLALMACVSRSGLSKIETGNASPTLDTLVLIAEALGVTLLDLVDVSKVDL